MGVSSWCDANRQFVNFTSPTRHHVRCMNCMRLLPFGPATDTPEVLVELRAAEIAADDGFVAHQLDANDCEACGYELGTMQNTAPTGARWEAGYLAYCIICHDPAREIATHRDTP
jgi:hypothetical protein